ncbi:zf-TFIIB domain-containing protein [Candidatus Pacearchaeota archaeon]|nr:zf-TFIIB domain-containing protein [Candidatus Pacearchaeota archaeon]
MSIPDWLFGKKCESCNKSRTKDSSGLCDWCILRLEAEKEAKEAKIICPKCKVDMKKEILEEGIIIDRCPKCTGVFLGKGELEKLQNIAEDEASSNHSSGLILGMAMSSSISSMSHH